jgi:hypothetical protein
MKKKMIHSLPGHFTHAASINHNDTLPKQDSNYLTYAKLKFGP